MLTDNWHKVWKERSWMVKQIKYFYVAWFFSFYFMIMKFMNTSLCKCHMNWNDWLCQSSSLNALMLYLFTYFLCFDVSKFCLKIEKISTKLPRRCVVLMFPLHKPFYWIVFVCLLGMSRKPSWACENLQPSPKHQSNVSEMNGIVMHFEYVPSTIWGVSSPSALGNTSITCFCYNNFQFIKCQLKYAITKKINQHCLHDMKSTCVHAESSLVIFE